MNLPPASTHPYATAVLHFDDDMRVYVHGTRAELKGLRDRFRDTMKRGHAFQTQTEALVRMQDAAAERGQNAPRRLTRVASAADLLAGRCVL